MTLLGYIKVKCNKCGATERVQDEIDGSGEFWTRVYRARHDGRGAERRENRPNEWRPPQGWEDVLGCYEEHDGRVDLCQKCAHDLDLWLDDGNAMPKAAE